MGVPHGAYTETPHPVPLFLGHRVSVLHVPVIGAGI